MEGKHLLIIGLFVTSLFIGGGRALGEERSESQSAAASTLQQQLMGTWRLISYRDRDKPEDGWTDPFGESPLGYIIYDNTGHMAVQIMKTPPTPPFASGDDEKPTPAEAKTAYDGYTSYFGTYTIDESQHIVTHHVEGSLGPSYIGTDQPRPFQISGDQLILGDQKTWIRIFQRVK